MITGTIRNKVDKIWTDIWAGGITNPLTVIEQLMSTAGQNGQFRTPRHIIRMMVELMQPTPDDRICENCTTSLIRVAAA